MVTEQEVRKFIHMSVFEKQRLRERDESKYNELFERSKKDFPTEGSFDSSDLADAKSAEKKFKQ